MPAETDDSYDFFIPETSADSSARTAPSVWISDIQPAVDGGRYPAKRTVGDVLEVSADILKDGHDKIRAVLRLRAPDGSWSEVPMEAGDNDRWSATAPLEHAGRYRFAIEAWPDSFRTWKDAFTKKLEAGDLEMPLVCEEGGLLIAAAAERAKAGGDADTCGQLEKIAAGAKGHPAAEMEELILSAELQDILDFWPDRRLATAGEREFDVLVERERAGFSAWYEFFPRSVINDGKTHGTFADCSSTLDRIASMGFDVIYLPPIHPIGEVNRKGKNNATTCQKGDVGSPWAIGSKHGGHRDIEPALGDLKDFDKFLTEAAAHGLEVALDFALQCAPDHPYVKSHPDWFHVRPDGSIMYAENPPKKYEDIYPINFHCEDWENLWAELIDVVRFWCLRGVRIFRVDNPHTKPIALWERLIREIQTEFPGTLFLAEAFTRPKMMAALGKIGFTQSYTYFTWRVSKEELTDYGTELTKGEMADFYRANFWPNTPDILAYHLMGAPPAMFKIRAALAATLSPNWGMYAGYELCENVEFGNGKEEYRDSEKYQLVKRDWSKQGNISAFIARLNRIRHENLALRSYTNLEFHPSSNDHIICYSKSTPDGGNRIVAIVSLDGESRQEGNVTLPIGDWGLGEAYFVRDLLHGDEYRWHGESNFVSLDPGGRLMHLFRVEAE